MARRPKGLLAKLGRERQIIAVTAFAIAGFGLLRLVFKLPIPIFELQIPEYGAIGGLAVAGIGLLLPDARGLLATVAGALLSSVSAIAILTVAARRWDVLVYGLPLALVAGTGLAVFCHSVLHGRPSLARTGMTAVVVGFTLAVVLYGLVIIRVYVTGQLATNVLAIVTGLAFAVAIASVASARRGSRRRTPPA